MGWLLRYAIASAVLAFIVTRAYDAMLGGATGRVVSATRAGLFVSVWTAVTTGLGLRSVTDGVRGLRRGTKGVGNRIKPH